jgi:translation initiation factor 1
MLGCAMTKSRNPFSALEELRASLPPGNERGPANAPITQADLTVRKPGPARAVVRMERKGRGGKEATVIEKLDLPASHLERWCKELKQALGCGGTVEGDCIILQGDLRTRIAPVLTAKGVVKVTIG